MKLRFFLTVVAAAAIVCILSGSKRMDIVAGKNFPLTCALCSDEASALCNADNALIAIARSKRKALHNGGVGETAAESLLWSESEISAASSRLAALCAPDNVLGAIVSALRAHGAYYLYNDLDDKEFIAEAFRQDAEGINGALSTYALGRKCLYPGNDSVSFDVRSQDFRDIQGYVNVNLLKETEADNRFCIIPLKAALKYMEASERDEAADYEPLAKGENSEAAAAAAITDWNAYPYTAIVVLGCGPEVPGQALDPYGRLRTEYAAMLYKEGKAPFIIVSGGRVHPRGTKFFEAVEMKRYLVEECGIPESAVFIDPHARHTTTNLRNASRIMYRAGFPMDRKAIVTSGKSHIDYLITDRYRNLCMRTMWIFPFTAGARLNDRELEFTPSLSALQCCPLDPLDP